MNPTTGSSLPAFGVRDLDAVRVDSLVRQSVPDRLGGLRQHGLVQDRNLVAAVEYAVQLAEQSRADDHRVWRVDENVDGHRFSHDAPFRVSGGDGRGRRWGLGAWTLGFGVSDDGPTAPRRSAAAALWSRRAAVLKAIDDVAHHGTGIAAVGVDPHRGDPPVQRNPFSHQRSEFLAAVATRQQRPHCALPPVRRTPSAALISR